MSSPGSGGPTSQRQGLSASMPMTSGDHTSAFAPKKLSTPLSTSKFANLNNAKINCETSASAGESYPMDKLLAKLSEQQSSFQQNDVAKMQEDEDAYSGFNDHGSSSNSLPITPATDGFSTTAPTTRPASATFDGSRSDPDEVLRLKLQLAQAQNQISKLDHELTQTRTTVPDGASTEHVQSRLSVPYGRDNPWTPGDDTQSDTSDSVSTKGPSHSTGIWGNVKGPFVQGSVSLPSAEPSPASWFANRGFAQGYADPTGLCAPDTYRAGRILPDNDLLVRQAAHRRQTRYDSRFGGQPSLGTGFGMGISDAPFESINPPLSGNGSDVLSTHSSMNLSMYPQYQQQPIGTPLSPHASEFTSKASWKADTVATAENTTYLPPTEPLNYRRLLDRNVNCNWKYIVDKIVCNNDQQASIFLQQKLKVGTPEQKYEIVEAIVAQAYPLMVNRFGNFLVQRCFEHGTPEQVIKIAEAIRGNTLNLSMDPFGCHVVQKAFDSIPEEYKAIMVHELLRRIPETVIHRYACHVWQKLFELRWTESPPQIMKFVNDALRGMWHEVALGETGSLVVQNIFENCLEDDKRPCIEEVLANIDIVAHGQFGNWCIQHICEHGAPPDRSRAVDHVIRYAAEYSTDQFASKVVEKCLKIGGSDFLGRYLDRVCEGRRDRTRIPLIDIASDQYGNYLVQWILNNASSQHREVVAAHIRKHMVSLRGSKFGSRVGMLCTNHAVTTRPGHGSGPSIPSRIQGTRYGSGNSVFR